MKYHNVPSNKVTVLHNGVNWDGYNEPFNNWEEQRTSFLAANNLPQNAHYLLFIGHGYWRKGLLPLLKAFSAYWQL